nr:DNA-directed RNA polymerase III subunit RPC4-like [Nerophis lumbriciformis]
METKYTEEVPCCSSNNSGGHLNQNASRGPRSSLGGGCFPSPTSARRLTSLRTRDLTLGGVLKKTKKTFEPNVNAVRKSKDDIKQEIQVTPKRERKQRQDRRSANRGRRKEKPQTIQCHSIFEQGPADSLRKTGWVATADVCDTTSPPKFQPVKKEHLDSDDEDEILQKLQRDDFICDPSLRNDTKRKPIQLPLSQTSTTSSQAKPFLGPPSSGAQVTTSHHRDQPSLVEKLQGLCLSGKEELFFMQLPDCMPARAQKPDVHPEPKSEKAGREKKPLHAKAQVSESPPVKCSPVLSEFPDGFLGKLQIRKSGKVEMKLADIVLDITDGAASSFLQQLVSVNLSDAKTGDMMVLGNIKHKLVVSPNFQNLLEQSTQQQQQGS